MTLKLVHTSCALLAIAGFLLRGYWHLSESAWKQHKLTKIIPHVIDTVFLLSGIAIIVVLHIQVLQHSWLLAKFAGLLVYIFLGVVAFRLGRTPQTRAVAFVAAVFTYAFVVGVAVSKSVGSWLTYFAA